VAGASAHDDATTHPAAHVPAAHAHGHCAPAAHEALGEGDTEGVGESEGVVAEAVAEADAVPVAVGVEEASTQRAA